jgi:hypothetical protein
LENSFGKRNEIIIGKKIFFLNSFETKLLQKVIRNCLLYESKCFGIIKLRKMDGTKKEFFRFIVSQPSRVNESLTR